MTPTEKRFAIIGTIVAVGSLAVALGQWLWPEFWQPTRQTGRSLASGEPLADVPAHRNDAVDRLLRADIVGASLKFVESLAGPPKLTIGNVSIYDANGCRIATYSEDGSTVNALKVALTSSCSFNWSTFFGGFPSREAFGTRVEDLSEHGLHMFKLDCFGPCGRSDLNMRFLFMPAGNSQHGVSYSAEVEYDQRSFEPIYGYGYPSDKEPILCAFIRSDSNEIVIRALSKVKISAVVVGGYFNDNYESMLSNEQIGRPEPYYEDIIESASTPANISTCETNPVNM